MMFGRCRFVLAMVLLCFSQKLCQSPDIQAESSSGKPRRDLLEQPSVAVRIAERGERAVAGMLGIWTVSPQPPEQIRLVGARVSTAAVKNLADLDAAAEHVGAGGLNVGNDQIQSLGGARRRLGEVLAEDD